MKIFFIANDSLIFPTKKCICNINVLNSNETLTNDIVTFEQLAGILIETIILKELPIDVIV